MIEKKRRARINRSLSELRVLISDLLKKELMVIRFFILHPFCSAKCYSVQCQSVRFWRISSRGFCNSALSVIFSTVCVFHTVTVFVTLISPGDLIFVCLKLTMFQQSSKFGDEHNRLIAGDAVNCPLSLIKQPVRLFKSRQMEKFTNTKIGGAQRFLRARPQIVWDDSRCSECVFGGDLNALTSIQIGNIYPKQHTYF